MAAYMWRHADGSTRNYPPPGFKEFDVLGTLVGSIDQTLAERASKYGDFTDLAVTAQNLKDEARRGVGWGKLSGNQREAVDMILHKIARVISGGDPDYKDNWHDIAGYAKMAEDRCGGNKE